MTTEPESGPPGFAHRVPIRVADTDALGHVNNAVMLTYLEEAKSEYLARRFGLRPNFVIARVEIDFVAELGLDARDVVVRVVPVELGRTSHVSEETICAPDGTVVCRSRSVNVWWDPVARRSAPWTPEQRAALEPVGVGSGRLDRHGAQT